MATTTWCFHHENIKARIPVSEHITYLILILINDTRILVFRFSIMIIAKGKTKILGSLIKISTGDFDVTLKRLYSNPLIFFLLVENILRYIFCLNWKLLF